MMSPDFSRLMAKVVNTRYAIDQGLEKNEAFIDEITEIEDSDQVSTLPGWVAEYIASAMNEIRQRELA
jgi:hypothetical protein